MSARLPTASSPTSSRPRAAAPPRVAMSTASAGVRADAGSGRLRIEARTLASSSAWWTAPELLDTEPLLVDRLGEMSVQSHSKPPCQVGRLAHQVLGHRERRARCDGDSAHGTWSGVVVGGDESLGIGQDGVFVLDQVVGRQAALRNAQAHRPATGLEANPDLAGCGYERLADARPAAGEDVVMVGRERAAGQQQAFQGDQGTSVDTLSVELRPERIEGLQPAEETRVGRVAASRPLIEMVVRIDETRHGHAVAKIEHLIGRRWPSGAHPDDFAFAALEPARVAAQHGGRSDKEAHSSASPARRTASKMRT